MSWCRTGTSVPAGLIGLRGVSAVLVMGWLWGLGGVSSLPPGRSAVHAREAFTVEEQGEEATEEGLSTSAARPGHMGGGRDRLDSPAEWIAIGSLCLAVVAGAYVAIRAARDSFEEDEQEEDESEDHPGVADKEDPTTPGQVAREPRDMSSSKRIGQD